jgi:hypothetical protein
MCRFSSLFFFPLLFFSPSIHSTHLAGAKLNSGGVVRVLHGLMDQPCQAFDPLIVDGVRSGFFMCEERKHNEARDMAAELLQLSRDLELPGYNDVRSMLMLPRVNTYAEINANKDIMRRLRSAYGDDVNAIEFVSGLLSEPSVGGGEVGMLLSRLVCSQMNMLRTTDPAYYERPGVFAPEDLEAIKGTMMTDLVQRNILELHETTRAQKAFQAQPVTRVVSTCLVSGWRNAGTCSTTCGSGRQEQLRDVLMRPTDPSVRCPPLSRFVPCNQRPCPALADNHTDDQPAAAGANDTAAVLMTMADDAAEDGFHDEAGSGVGEEEVAVVAAATEVLSGSGSNPSDNKESDNKKVAGAPAPNVESRRATVDEVAATPIPMICATGPLDDRQREIKSCRSTATGHACYFEIAGGVPCSSQCTFGAEWLPIVCGHSAEILELEGGSSSKYAGVYMWTGIGLGCAVIVATVFGVFEVRRRRILQHQRQHQHQQHLLHDNVPVYIARRDMAPPSADSSSLYDTLADAEADVGTARLLPARPQQRQGFVLQKKPSQMYILDVNSADRVV